MCVLVSYSQAVSVFVSAYTLLAISVDRYIAILYPLRPKMSRFQAKLIIFKIWIVSLITPSSIVFVSKLVQPPLWVENNITDHYICTEVWPNNDYRVFYSFALMILQYVLPLTVLVFTYTKIAIAVWGKKTPGEAESTRDRKMAASKRKVSYLFSF